MQDQTTNTTEDAKKSSAQLEESLFHFLTGYGRGRPEHLEQVIRYPHWQARARVELDRRMGEFAEQLDMETLIAIAEGHIDIVRIAKRVLDAAKHS